ncbi:uncharacterized protein LOC6582336 [Drosophila mojavensis]|uniref:MADF domain-containing protein n=1 Tax=Drosophila mojavensis TaxID=7230 RepID=B4KWA8_DROMO|nr:uncharacterized protein LOC6582336 [Drosophila mojavensis]EDW18515.1 uncharacterized protein Dmoj_GI12053 [Drosophila mojavensis]
MTAIPQTDRWQDFFDTYRQLPALWRVSDEQYKNQKQRKAAYEKLLQCYKKIDGKANMDTMRRKINGIRTCFRRELRKVEYNEEMNKVYVPHLWYFNELTFLCDEVGKATGTEITDGIWDKPDESMNEFKDDEDMDHWSESETKVFDHVLPTSSGSPVEPAQLEQTSPAEQLQPLRMCSVSHCSRDEAAIYAEGWATSYRKLDEKNKLLAKKAIEEILVLGQLNKLEFNSVKMPN